MAQARPYVNNGPMSQDVKPRVNNKYIVIDNCVHKIHTMVVHRFQLGDVEDPDLYAAEPLLEWQASKMGKWVMERAVETLEWQRNTDYQNYFLQYTVIAKLKDVDYTWWHLKWGLDKQVS